MSVGKNMDNVHSAQRRSLRPSVGMRIRYSARQASQAGKPEKLKPYTWATPFICPMLAIAPLLWYENGLLSRCSRWPARLWASWRA